MTIVKLLLIPCLVLSSEGWQNLHSEWRATWINFERYTRHQGLKESYCYSTHMRCASIASLKDGSSLYCYDKQTDDCFVSNALVPAFYKADTINVIKCMTKLPEESLPCIAPYNATSVGCLYFSEDQKTWTQSKDICEDLGGSLAEPSDFNSFANYAAVEYPEKNFMTANINFYDHIFEDKDYWLGIKKHVNNGTWAWLSGLVLLQSDSIWKTGEPNTPDSNNPAAGLNTNAKKLFDKNNSLEFLFICSYQTLHSTSLPSVATTVITVSIRTPETTEIMTTVGTASLTTVLETIPSLTTVPETTTTLTTVPETPTTLTTVPETTKTTTPITSSQSVATTDSTATETTAYQTLHSTSLPSAATTITEVSITTIPETTEIMTTVGTTSLTTVLETTSSLTTVPETTTALTTVLETTETTTPISSSQSVTTTDSTATETTTTPPTATTTPACSSPYTSTPVGCLYVSTTKKSWNDAQSECVLTSGNLVEPSDFTAFAQHIDVNYNGNHDYWVGLIEDSSGWKWLSGQVMVTSDSRWENGEPNDGGYDDAACLNSKKRALRDNDANMIKRFICERQLN